jgi:hypothetical protein
MAFRHSLHGYIDITIDKAREVHRAKDIRPNGLRQMKIQALDQNESMTAKIKQQTYISPIKV